MYIEAMLLPDFIMLIGAFKVSPYLALGFFFGLFTSWCMWYTVEHSRARGEKLGLNTFFWLLRGVKHEKQDLENQDENT